MGGLVDKLSGTSLRNRSSLTGDTQALLSERGRPRPPPSSHRFCDCNFPSRLLDSLKVKASVSSWMVLSEGAAGDGRAPTEELSCLRSRNFRSMRIEARNKNRSKVLKTLKPHNDSGGRKRHPKDQSRYSEQEMQLGNEKAHGSHDCRD